MYNIPVIDLTATGKNIERLRKSTGKSVKDLQAILGFSNPQSIYKWQSGACLPTIDNLIILSSVFGVKLDDIIVYHDCVR